MQEELERRQRELEQKAAELAAREEALRQGTTEFRRQHNWPPLPSFCPVKPCFFQDINVDIRPEFQRIVRMGYQLWLAFVVIEIFNLIGSILLTTSSTDKSYGTSYALITLVFFTPLTYLTWFRPLYKAFKNDSSFNFMVFFFVFFMQTFVVGLWSLGLPTDGPACGLFTAIGVESGNIRLKLVIFLIAILWMVYTFASVLLIVRVHRIYRSSGASLEKARSEFTQGVISNRYVQQTVAQAARTTVNQAFSNVQNNSQSSQQQPPQQQAPPPLPSQLQQPPLQQIPGPFDP